jgi:hypothetical protein
MHGCCAPRAGWSGGWTGHKATKLEENSQMKLVFGLFGAILMVAFLASFVIKVKAISMVVVALIGIALMLVDLWQARNEPDT